MQVHGRLVPVVDVLREGLEHDLLELLGDAPIVGRRRHDLDVADLLERGEVALADEEPLTGEQLVEDDADREDVAASIEREPADLLGRHVPELALQDARLGLARLAGRLGDPEVDDLRLAVVADQNVLRGDVAVDEVELAARRVLLVVGVVEPLADLHDRVAGHGHRDGLAALASPVEDRPEVLPVDELHRDEERVRDLTEVEDLGDVRVRQLHGDLRLVDEHRDELLVLRDRREDPLHRDEPFRSPPRRRPSL
ncbi:MAG: hypothetical protein R3B82_05055 [Sandaracinaceae bacterium]